MIGALVTLVIYIIILGLVVWLLLYVIGEIPLGEPFQRMARVIIMVVAVLILITLLLQVFGIGGLSLPKVTTP